MQIGREKTPNKKGSLVKNQPVPEKKVPKPITNLTKKVSRTQQVDAAQSVVYRKLPGSVEFRGHLDATGSGKGFLTNYNEQYCLEECIINNNIIIKEGIRVNLISNEKVDGRNFTSGRNIVFVCQKLYEQYLRQEVDHKIQVFFTQFTEQFINISKTKADYQRFKHSYKNYTQLFIYTNSQISFALVVIIDKIYVLTNSINMKSTNILHDKIEHLQHMGYSVQKLICPITLSAEAAENYSAISNGYFIIPLLAIMFRKNSISESDLVGLSSLCHQLDIRKDKRICDRISMLIRQKKEVLEFADFYSDLFRGLTTFRRWKSAGQK